MTVIDIKPEFTESTFRNLLQPLLHDPTKANTYTTTHLAKDGSLTHLAKDGSLIPVEILLQYVTPNGKDGRFVARITITSRKLNKQV